MAEKQHSYQELSKRVAEELEKIIEKYGMDMDQAIDHFSFFLAKQVVKHSEDRVEDSMNFVHSFSRYVMALHIDEKNGIKHSI